MRDNTVLEIEAWRGCHYDVGLWAGEGRTVRVVLLANRQTLGVIRPLAESGLWTIECCDEHDDTPRTFLGAANEIIAQWGVS